jgi:hypothetical protein
VYACCLAGSAVATPSLFLRHENHRRELAEVFHPQAAAEAIQAATEPITLFSQATAVVIVIGGLMMRLRRDQAQMGTLASMVIRIFFIASVPLWKTWALELADGMADQVGCRALPSVRLQMPADTDRQVSSPVLERLWAIGEQWVPDSSPLKDSVDGGWTAHDGNEEENLRLGWNWTKAGVNSETVDTEAYFGAAQNAERAGILHRLLLAVAGSVQLSYISLFLAEHARLLLFHAGCALAPLCIAGLGTRALATPSLRALLGLAAVAFWPLGWGVANQATLAMGEGLSRIFEWSCSAAMNPKLPAGEAQSIALSAPYLSWALLITLAAMTMALCAWVVGSLAAGAWCLNRLSGSGARLLEDAVEGGSGDSG